MTYQVEVSPAARRSLKGLHPQVAGRLVTAMELLADNPRPPAAKPLRGRPAWRVRVGDYRIVYEIHDDVLRVIVVTVGHRREVYRQS